MIHSQQRRLERWAEHFGEQFNQPPAIESIQKPSEPAWIVNSDYPTEEVQREIANLKRDKAAGPDGIPPLIFKEEGVLVTPNLTRLLRIAWNEIPEEWSSSTVNPRVQEPCAKITVA